MSNKYVEAIMTMVGEYPEKDFSACAQEHFDEPRELYRISEAYCRVGRFEDACTLYKRIIELNPAWIDILDLYGRALWAMHEYEEAKRYWGLFLREREDVYRKIGVPQNFYTVDDVFTSAFGNFAHFYPMDRYGYLSQKDEFYYHPGRVRSDVPEHRNPVSNEALRSCVFGQVRDDIPGDILSLLAQDDYVTRLPFYCGIDLKRLPTHHHPAYAEKMLSLIREGAPARLQLQSKQIDECERRLTLMGVDFNRPIVSVHARESGYWARTGDRSNSIQNADITSYIPAIQLLANNGYQVVRLGDRSMKSLPPMKSVFDYAHSDYKSAALDLYVLTRSTFLLGSSSGPASVASIFNVPLLATNWIAVHKTPFLPSDLVLLKKFKYKNQDALVPFEELVNLDYGEYLYYNLDRKNITVVDNTPEELLSATNEMLERLRAEDDGVDRKSTSIASRFPGQPVVSEAQFARASYFS